MTVKKTRLNIFLYWLFISVLFCSAFFWGTRLLIQTELRFEAAAEATKSIGVYARRIGNYTERAKSAKNSEIFVANQKLISSFIRKAEINHIALSRGNPVSSKDALFSDELKSIYYAMPTNLVNQVRSLIKDAKVISSIEFAEIAANETKFRNIKTAVSGNLIPSIGHISKKFQQYGEAKLSKSIFMLASILLTFGILVIVAYIFVFDDLSNNNSTAHSAESVSSVIGGLSVFPGEKETDYDSTEEESYST